MLHPVITMETLAFLNTLKTNNNRDWFTDNKVLFTAAQNESKEFFAGIMEGLRTHDEMERLKIFRIYRDVRFSKDKTPYKVNFSASYSRAGAQRRGGYYVHIQPKGSFIAAGFWDPEKEDLLRIRKEFEEDASDLLYIINQKPFQKVWGSLQGDELKTAPKGFEKDHPNISILRKKQFVFIRKFTDKEVVQHDFPTKINDSFKTVRPYFDLMSTILTTNLNGESLID